MDKVSYALGIGIGRQLAQMGATESAIQATKQALYNLDHPLEYVPKSIEVQRACMKEREFYVAFLERLEKL